MGRADRCPYGTRPDPADPARLIDHPQEQAAITLIGEKRAAGLSLREIASALETAGAPCRGERWWPSTIRAILARHTGALDKIA